MKIYSMAVLALSAFTVPASSQQQGNLEGARRCVIEAGGTRQADGSARIGPEHRKPGTNTHYTHTEAQAVLDRCRMRNGFRT
jgi:hypothetical protein